MGHRWERESRMGHERRLRLCPRIKVSPWRTTREDSPAPRHIQQILSLLLDTIDRSPLHRSHQRIQSLQSIDPPRLQNRRLAAMARRLRARILPPLQGTHAKIQVNRETRDKDIYTCWTERLLSHITLQRLVADRRTHVPPPAWCETLDGIALKAPPSRPEGRNKRSLQHTGRLRRVLEDSLSAEHSQRGGVHNLHLG